MSQLALESGPGAFGSFSTRPSSPAGSFRVRGLADPQRVWLLMAFKWVTGPFGVYICSYQKVSKVAVA